MIALTLPMVLSRDIRDRLVAIGCRWNGQPFGTAGFGWVAPTDTYQAAQALCDSVAERQGEIVRASIAREMLDEGSRMD